MPRDINYKMLPEGLRGGMKRYIENGIKPGDFLQAVICNKLRESFARADFVNSVRMYDIVEFLYGEAPSTCCGSVEIMNDWIEKGGLNA